MARLDDRLKRDLDRAGLPADPVGVYEQLVPRMDRKRTAGRVQSVVLTLAVAVGSLGGVWALSQVFRVGDQPPATTLGPTNGSIAVTWARGFPDPEQDLALVSIDDSGMAPLTSGTELDSQPAWSPDGSTIAFWRAPRGSAGAPGIYTIPAAGGEPRLLLQTDLSIWSISWSPRGDRVAFVGVTPVDGSALDMPMAVYTVAADGTDLRQLTSHGQVMEVAWAPDGTTLAITRQYALGESRIGQDISVLDLATGEERRLTSDGAAWRPSWSPDGTQIAFTSSQDRRLHDGDLYVMDADGSDRARLTTTPGIEEDTAWAPDGTAIAVTRLTIGEPRNCDLALVAPAGSTERILLDGPVEGACPMEVSWQPTPATGPQTPPPVSTQTSGPPPQGAEDIGLGLLLCDVGSVRGTFIANGTDRQTAFVGVQSTSSGACPGGSDDTGNLTGVVAIDLSGDGVADVASEPFTCFRECRFFSLPDVDGDRAAEILVVTIGGSPVLGLTLFDVTRDGTPSVEPVTVGPPGDPAGDFDPGEVAQLWLGGDEFYLYTLRCGDPQMRDGPGLVYTAAESIPHDSPNARWHAHRVVFALRDGMLTVMDVGDFTEPISSGAEGPSFASGETLCGSDLGP